MGDVRVTGDLTAQALGATVSGVYGTPGPKGYSGSHVDGVPGGVDAIAPPVANFFALALSGPTPLTVTFINTSERATSYSWKSGDGQTSTVPTPTFTYAVAGSYSPSLTVTNSGGSNTLTRSGYVTVTAAVQATPRTSFYRNAQTHLFQPVPVAKPSTLGGSEYNYDSNAKYGPTYTYVDTSTGWRWTNAGGDWIDAALTRQGTTHWATVSVASAGVKTANVTSLVQKCFTTDRWLAIFMQKTGDYVTMAGPLTPGGYAPPVITGTYVDGASFALLCKIVARSAAGNSVPISTDQSPSGTALQLPVFVEFERPTKAVSSATLAFTVVVNGSGTPVVSINLADPQINANAASGTTGLAASAGDLDAGITSVPNVIGAHRYVDGSALSDFCHPGVLNYNSEFEYDPAIWGMGATNLSKLPHVGLGKWIDGAQDENQWSLVSSAYSGDGFTPLAPGVGALRIVMPDKNVNTGDEQGNAGTTAAARKIMLPEPEFGALRTIFVRYYVRFGTPYAPTVDDRKEIRRFGSPEWTAMAGKWGILPSHVTTYGGFSGSSGGGWGWQMRLKWAECEVDQGGPDEGGIQSGLHLYDFQTNNPPGYRYNSGAVADEGFDAYGGDGLGGVVYAGRWYCIEHEVTLNSVDAAAPGFDATPWRNWTPDGEIRTWVDGRLAYERTGMVMRSLPRMVSVDTNSDGIAEPHEITYPAEWYSAGYIRAAREVGHKDLLFNWFHGGLNKSTYQRTMFITGLVWGKERIGPMKMPLPTWVPAQDNSIAQITQGSGVLTNNWRDSVAPYYHEFWAVKANNDYSTTVLNPYLGPYGTILSFGGGHSATNYNAVTALVLNQSSMTFKRLTSPTPTFGSGTDNTTRTKNATHEIYSSTTYGEPLYGETYMAGGQTQLDTQLRPVTNHSYAYLNIVGPEGGGAAHGSLFMPASIASTSRSNVVGTAGIVQYAVHKVDFDGDGLTEDGYRWARDSDSYKSGIWSQAAPIWSEYVPAQKRIYIQANVNHSPRWYDLTSKTFVEGTGAQLTRNANFVNSGRMFHVAKRNLLVFAGPAAGAGMSTALQIQYMSVGAADTNPGWSGFANLSATIQVPHNGGALSWQTACWCEDNEMIIVGAVYGDDNCVYEITIPAMLTDPWVCDRVAFRSGQTMPWPHKIVGAYSGGFWMSKRWTYNRRVKAIVWIPKVGDYAGAGPDSVWVYRPRGV